MLLSMRTTGPRTQFLLNGDLSVMMKMTVTELTAVALPKLVEANLHQ